MDKTIIESRSQAVKIIYELKEHLSNSFFNLNPWELKKDDTARRNITQILTHQLDNIPAQQETELMYEDIKKETLTPYGELAMKVELSMDRDYIKQLSLSIDSLIDFIINTDDKELANYLLSCSEAIQEWELIFFLFKCKVHDKNPASLTEALFPLEDFFQQDHNKIDVYGSDESNCDELLWYFKNEKDILNKFIKNIIGANDNTVIEKVNFCYTKGYLNVEKNAKGKFSVKSFHYCLNKNGYYKKTYKTFSDGFGDKQKISPLI